MTELNSTISEVRQWDFRRWADASENDAGTSPTSTTPNLTGKGQPASTASYKN